MKVLVVEDDPRISDVLEYALKAEGYEVQTAQRGREAAEITRNCAPAYCMEQGAIPG